MNKATRKLFTAGAGFMFAGVLAFSSPSEASAQELTAATWSPRTVQQISHDLDNMGEEGTTYTFQWGDTLSAVAGATDLSVSKLAKINNINNANVIFAGNTIHLSGDHKVVTVEQNDEVVSYDVSSEDDEVTKVETPNEVKETVKKKKQQPAKKAEAETAEKTETAEAAKQEQPAEKTEQAAAPQGRTMVVEATAYSTNQPSLSDYTYTGINLRENPNVIAVDPNVIPLGSTVHVPGYGTYIAGDTGSAIKGNRIDVHITDLNAAISFGRKTIEIQIVK